MKNTLKAIILHDERRHDYLFSHTYSKSASFVGSMKRQHFAQGVGRIMAARWLTMTAVLHVAAAMLSGAAR